MALPLVAIVGRPNVGKSSLFNRILGQRRAIVDPMAGLTRDRLYAEADWRGRNFTIVDTAGLVLGKERDEVPALRELRRRMEEQTAVAIEEADVILLVVDVREGVTPIDSDIAELLRRARTPVVLAANKADAARATPEHRRGAHRRNLSLGRRGARVREDAVIRCPRGLREHRPGRDRTDQERVEPLGRRPAACRALACRSRERSRLSPGRAR